MAELAPAERDARRKIERKLERTAKLTYNPKMPRKLSRFRLWVQGAFLVGFLALFLFTYHPASRVAFLEWLMQLDPLPWIATSLADRSWARGAALALLMVGAGVFIGRFFCSMICPLGALIDVTDWAFFKRIRRKAPYQWLTRWKSLKFWILGYLLLAAVCGHMHIHWFDPLAIVVRICALVIWPIVNVLFFLGFDALKDLAGAQGWQSLANSHIYAPRLALDLASVAVIAVVFGGQLLQSRFWCRNLCPVGAFFGCISRPAAVDGVVDDTCTDCKICVHTCTMGAIDLDPVIRFGPECIQCNTCVTVCPPDSIKFVPRRGAGLLGFRWVGNLRRRWRREPVQEAPYVQEAETLVARLQAFDRPSLPGTPKPPRVSRRAMLRAGMVAGGVAATGVTLGLTARASSAAVLRPPGSVAGDDFLDLCIRCDACVKACTYNALVPMGWREGGFANIWTPQFDMRRSACDTDCNACGQVCPTGAIRPLALSTKNQARIGLAIVNPQTCWLWEGRACDVCVAACDDAGYFAIERFFADGFEKIHVKADACTGCGWCEHHCPENKTDGVVTGPAAIVVEPLARAGRILAASPPEAPPPPGAGGMDFDEEGVEEESSGG